MIIGDKFDRYVIKDKLGEGGFGQVFKAYDEKLGREVAIKVLPRNQVSILEAQILAKLDNPHIVKIHDLLEGPQSIYLVMEYIPHSSIMQQKLNLEEILDLAIQVCTGLAEIHRHGFVHQDIKPGNILRDAKTGKCKITDFGIAAKTKSGKPEIIGTPRFMAPEQRRGGIVDQRTDIYGLAKVISALIQHNQIQVVPARLGQILRKATEYNSRQRFKDVEEFKTALIKLRMSLGSWQLMEQVLPEFGDLVKRKRLLKNVVNVVLAMITTLIVMRLPLIETVRFYQSSFQLYLAPLLVGLVAAYSLSLAVFFIFVLIFPPLMVSWASLAVLIGLSVLLLGPWIFRYPLIFISLVLAMLWPSPKLLLVLPILAGYYFGFPGSLLTGSLLPFCYYLVDEIEIINLPVPIRNGNWLITGLSQISIDEMWEIVSMVRHWSSHLSFDYGVLGLIMGIGAAILATRGKLGLWLFIGVTGLGFLIVLPQLLSYWLITSTTLLVSIFLKNKISKREQSQEQSQFWNKPTLACK